MPNAALSAFQLARTPEQLAVALGCPERVTMLNAMNTLDLGGVHPGLWRIPAVRGGGARARRLRSAALLSSSAPASPPTLSKQRRSCGSARWARAVAGNVAAARGGSTIKFAGLAGRRAARAGIAAAARLHRQAARHRRAGDQPGSLLLSAGVPGTPLALGVSWVAPLLALLLNAIRRPRH